MTLEDVQKEIENNIKAEKKSKRNFEQRFQAWCDKMLQLSSVPEGKCGWGMVCDWCEGADLGRPCIKALNNMLKEKLLQIDYEKATPREVWTGDYWRADNG
jgi:hypothetical protein